jgi:hypothetical protein
MGRLLIRGMTPAEHAATPHTNEILAPNFLSDTKGDIGMGLNKLLTQSLRLREYDTGTMVVENRDGTAVLDLLVRILKANYINFQTAPAQINMYPRTDAYVMFRGWDGANYFNAAQLDISGFKILNGTLCPYREYYATAGVDYVDFINLNLNTHKVYVLTGRIYNPTGSASNYYIYAEGDYTVANYYSQYLGANGSNVLVSRDNLPRLISPVYGNNRCSFAAFLWLDPSGYFRWFSLNSRATGSNIEIDVRSGCKTGPVQNVTYIRIAADVSGAIGGGSSLHLFRLGG